MFLFCRWMATCYSDVMVDNNMLIKSDKRFNDDKSMSLLLRETGYWYKEQLKHFNEVVYPNYVKNGSVREAELFLMDL